MNYLGHIFFSNDNHELMYANLYGDFVKGSRFSHYNEVIQNGILLHRQIDFYLDQHLAVKQLLHTLYGDLPKVAGIAVDLYFDHLLAKNWTAYHTQPSEEFLQLFYEYEPSCWNEYSDSFKQFSAAMRKYKWLNHYSEFEGLTKMCRGVSQQLSFVNKLTDAAAVFLIHETAITSCFQEFMSDAIAHFKKSPSIQV
jgi:acyl carrier protein phosphodiesterase